MLAISRRVDVFTCEVLADVQTSVAIVVAARSEVDEECKLWLDYDYGTTVAVAEVLSSLGDIVQIVFTLLYLAM